MEGTKIISHNWEEKIKEIDKKLRTYPSGSLVRRGSYYSHVQKNKEIAITKDERLIRLLCRKKFLLIVRQHLKTNISLMAHPTSKILEITNEEIIDSLPASYQGLPKDYFFHPSVKKWLEKPYQKNSYPQDSTLTTGEGVQLRSKSEVLVGIQLEYFGLNYRADSAFTIGNKKIYPDFIIVDLYTGKFIVWEHFGALHEKEYVDKMYTKMKLYRDYGHKYFEDVIYTFEPDVEKTEHLRNLINERIIKKFNKFY